MWWLPVTRMTSNPADFRALTTRDPLRPESLPMGGSSGLLDHEDTDKRHDIFGDVIAFVAPHLQRKLDGFLRHAQRFGLVFSVGDDLRQCRNKHSKAALWLGPKMDRVASLRRHRASLGSDPVNVQYTRTSIDLQLRSIPHG